MRSTLRGIGLAAVVGLAGIAQANAELVTNGGFETGDLTGWTTSGGAVIGATNGTPLDGAWSAFLADGPGTPGTLSQLLATTPGSTYTISFLLQNLDATQSNSLSVMFGSDTLFSETDALADAAPVTETFQDTAGPGGTLLSFTDTNAFEFLLDDVSVTLAVPEPSSVALFGAGLIGLCGMAARRRRSTST